MPQPDTRLTSAEHMVAAIMREIEDGDVLLEGIGTFLPTSAYLLAQFTHAPNAVRLCPVGNIFTAEPHTLSCAAYEFETLQRGVFRFTYWDVNGSYLPTFIPGTKGKWKEFLRPAQVDATGRTNNVVIGPYDAPRVRLPGAAGLPDGAPIEPALYMYVPRHDRNTFVSRVDFASAPGLEEGGRPHFIVSNLAVMRFAPDGVLEVEALQPCVTREEVLDNTGFDLRFRSGLVPFPSLSEEELTILRREVDPQSLRDLELYSGEERLSRIEALAKEDAAHERLYRTLATALDSYRGVAQRRVDTPA
jgi:acyl CoA:acetate/3-ketoacid CoA transferase beta subunit